MELKSEILKWLLALGDKASLRSAACLAQSCSSLLAAKSERVRRARYISATVTWSLA